jgi:hypothetical protein
MSVRAMQEVAALNLFTEIAARLEWQKSQSDSNGTVDEGILESLARAYATVPASTPQVNRPSGEDRTPRGPKAEDRRR